MNLIDVTKKFATPEACNDFIEEMRWPDGVTCVACEGKRVTKYTKQAGKRKRLNAKTGEEELKAVPARILYVCLDCELKFSVTTGTIFHDTHLDLEKWFMAVALMVNAKKGLSALQMKRDLKVAYKTAWYLNHRIRKAMALIEQADDRKSSSRSKSVANQLSFNPSRLTVARRRRGLSKTRLADLIGVDLRAVTAYESGEYPPAPDTLTRLQSALGFPTEFFYGDDLDELSPETASFRAMTRMSASKRDMALGQGAIAFHFSRWLDTKFELPTANLPDLGREPNPEAAAESLRRAWGIGELAIRNMIHLLEAKGVRVFSLAVDTKEVDAFSVWKDEVPFIFLNTYKSAEHSRFDAAHELGHLVLHKHGGPRGRDTEKEAHLFASAFLMPRGSVIAHAPKFPTYPVLADRKKIWLTSVSALNYRFHALGLLTDWQYRGLCIEIAKRGRDAEPNEVPRETSLLLPKMLQSLYEDGITRSQIARELAIPTSELEKLIFGLAIAGIKGGRNEPPARNMSVKLRSVK